MVEHKEEKNEYLLGSLNFLKEKNFKEEEQLTGWERQYNWILLFGN